VMFFPSFAAISPQNVLGQPLGGYVWLVTDVVEIFNTPGGERTGFLRAGDFVEEFGMQKHMAQDFVVHKEGCSPTTKGLTTVLKPINEYSSPLWKVIGETNSRHKPDLNADVDGTLSVGIIFEELDRGGSFKEWIRHSLGWSSSFIIEREAQLFLLFRRIMLQRIVYKIHLLENQFLQKEIQAGCNSFDSVSLQHVMQDLHISVKYISIITKEESFPRVLYPIFLLRFQVITIMLQIL